LGRSATEKKIVPVCPCAHDMNSRQMGLGVTDPGIANLGTIRT